MTLFSAIQIKRNTAWVVLLVLVFALASGVANACLLDEHETHSIDAAKASQAAAEPVAHRQAALGDLDHSEDSDGAKQSCLKACDDGSNTLLKAQAEADQTDPRAAPLVATLWTSATPVVVSRRLYDLQAPSAGPPFRVRYSRLTL